MADAAEYEGRMGSLILARDIPAVEHLVPNGNIAAVLRGLIIERKKTKRAIFLTLMDVSGSAQILLLQSEMSEDEFEQGKQLRKGDTVAVTGKLGFSEKGIISVIPKECPVVLSENSSLPMELDDLPFRTSGSRIVHARIKRRLRTYLEGSGFIEIEPRYISTEWNGHGLEPLRVQYPGFGLNVYLTPSPVPQIFEALLSTGQLGIFSAGNLFTTSYRDVHSSTEAAAVFLVERAREKKPDERIWQIAMQCLSNIFSETSTALPEIAELFDHKDRSVQVAGWPDDISKQDGLEVQWCRKPSMPERERRSDPSLLDAPIVKEYARVALQHNGKNYSLAECSFEERFESLETITTVFHTEHILDLLSTAPFRNLRTSTFWSE